MATETAGRKLSFEILSSPEHDAVSDNNNNGFHITQPDPIQTTRNKNRNKHKRNKKKNKKLLEPSIPEDLRLPDSRSLNSDSVTTDPHFSARPLQNGHACNGLELGVRRLCYAAAGSVSCVVVEEDSASAVAAGEGRSEVAASGFNFGELRQRAVNGGSSEDLAVSAAAAEAVVDSGGKEDGGGAMASPAEKATNEPGRNVGAKLETVESLDWRRLMAEDPNL